MPTLEELFRSKPIGPNGETASKIYDIRNSKDIRISTSDPLVNNTGFVPARLLRKVLSSRTNENFFEQELTGVRIIRGFSTPVIYGNEVARITLRTTPLLDLMKTATSGEVANGGLIGGKLTKLRDDINSKLGIPQAATPTFVVNGLNAGGSLPGANEGTKIINLGLTQDRMNDLAAIRKSAEGSLLGKFLKQTGGGNLKTIGRQALGSAIKLGKDAIRKKLFGDGKRTLDVKGVVLINNSVTGFTKESSEWYNVINVNYGDNKEATPKNDPTTKKVDKDGERYSKTISPDADTAEGRNDLSYKQQLDYEPLTEWRGQGGDIAPIRFSQTPDRIPKFTDKAEKIKITTDYYLTNSTRGFESNKDLLNEIGPYKGTKKIGKTDIDDIDFVTLKFKSMMDSSIVNFRSTITGLTETFSPSWDSAKFIGSAFNFYTFSSIERSVSFNFKVYSLSIKEHKAAWQRLNFLAGLTYPAFTGANAIIAPFMEITIGDMYKNKAGFIESLTFTIDDNHPWQIQQANRKEQYVSSDIGKPLTTTEEDITGYVLPMIVDVSITVKFVESRSTTSAKKFYNFQPVTS
jgi:hypothetical protein